MSLATIDELVEELIDREGRQFVNHPADKGGSTKFGITQKTLMHWRKQPVTEKDVEDLTEIEASAIYKDEFFYRPGFGRVNDPYLRSLLFDSGVQHSPRRAIRWLQQALRLVDDGVLGERTEIAVNTQDPIRTYQRVLARRIVFYGEIITHDKKLQLAKDQGIRLQAENALGWLRRVASYVEV